MTIGPISELSSMFSGMPAGNSSAGQADKAGTDSFQSFMKTASEAISAVSELQTGSRDEGFSGGNPSESDSYMKDLPTASDKYEASDSRANEKQGKIEDSNRETIKDNNADKKVDKSDSLSNAHKDVKDGAKSDKASTELKDKMVDEAAKTLGISVEELNDILAQLGIGAADLLNPENISLLVSEVKGDGDMMSLITDGELGQLVSDLNQMIANLTEEVAVENDISAAFLKDMLLNDDAGTLGAEKIIISEENGLNVANEAAGPLVSDGKADISGDVKEDFNRADALTMDTNANDNQVQELVAKESSETGNNGSHKESNSENHSDLNGTNAESVSQMFVNEQPVTTEQFIENISTASTSEYVSQQDIINQVQEQIKLQYKEDLTQLSMQLNPETLGTVNLNVTSKDGVVSAQLIAQNENVQAALEAQIAMVKESLELQGIKIEAIEVTVSSHGFEENLERGNDSNQQQDEMQEQISAELRKATRKLNINGDVTDEMIEELDEDQIVTAKMMKADGNSMDYKV